MTRLLLSLITLDNLYCSSWFLYMYYNKTKQDLTIQQKERFMANYTMVYAPTWFIDRYIYYAIVYACYILFSLLHITNPFTTYYVILLAHNPYIFNNCIRILAQPLFNKLTQIRYSIMKVVFLKFIADIAKLTCEDEKQFIVNFEYIGQTDIFKFAFHYVCQILLTALYGSWKYFPIYKPLVYYYYFRYGHMYKHISADAAKSYVKTTVGKSWETMNMAAFAHAIYTMSRAQHHMENKYIHWLYKLSVLSCIWTFAELASSYSIIVIICMWLQYDKLKNASLYNPESYIHVLSITASPIIGMIAQSYFVAALLCTFPIINSFLRYIVFAYYSYTIHNSSLKDYMSISVPENTNTSTSTNTNSEHYSQIVTLPYSKPEYVHKVEEPFDTNYDLVDAE